MKEEWLFQGAIVPVDVETTAALVAEIHRLIDVIGGIALAQAAQEPVAWADLLKEAQQIVESKFLWKKFIDGTPLANDIACWMADFAQQYTTPPQSAQEPVAWALEWTFDGEEKGRRLYDDERHCKLDAENDGGICRPLVYGYTAPPQRPWVGLTDDEIWGAVSRIGTSNSDVNPHQTIHDARAIEAKLKEKNG